MTKTNIYQKLAIATTCAALGSMISGKALAVTVKAIATGSTNPTPISVGVGGTLQNGDFSIIRKIPQQPSIIGDGEDESTRWELDFSQSEGIETFLDQIAIKPLASAKLTFTATVSPGNYIATDTISMLGVKSIKVTDIPSFPSGGTQTVELDLIKDFGFTSDEILGSFNSEQSGVIPWAYQDDAIISSAQLELTPTPEPLTILGSATALGFGALFKRQQSKKQKES
ncbi:PEP-CTERM sorting domain-containing protein [Coleofasciculus sp. E1-EBD-02]|jgi:hypothetical protein|uniref:PEP-CTERM sorting domain-containing protein n=1 Tax=Coleofasciculus sp. E1-EBD-02 TaxID=3068481 RepID=UPI0032FA19D6